MGAILDFANITPPCGAIEDIRKMVFEDVLASPALNTYFKVLPGTYTGDRSGYIGSFGLLGVACQGCNPEYGDATIPLREKVWEVNCWEIALTMCYEPLMNTMLKYALNKGVRISDLVESGEISNVYFQDIILRRLEESIREMLFRMAWFGDKNAANVSGGGIIKDGTDVRYFNWADGFWKRLLALVAANADRRTTIAANAEATIAAQKAAMNTPGAALNALDALIEAAPLKLRSADGQVIFMTQAFKDAYDRDVRETFKGCCFDNGWNLMFDGLAETTYNGRTLVVLPTLDVTIQTYEGDGTKWNDPYRLIYTTRDNLLIGTNAEGQIQRVDYWWERKERMNYVVASDTMGTMIGDDELIQVAY